MNPHDPASPQLRHRKLTQVNVSTLPRWPLPRAPWIVERVLPPLLLLALAALPTPGRASAQPPPQPVASESAHSNAGPIKEQLIVTISSEGPMTFQGETVTLDELQKKLLEVARGNPQATLAIQADQEATWAKVAKVFDAAKAAHINVTATLSKPTPPSDWSDKQLSANPSIGGIPPTPSIGVIPRPTISLPPGVIMPPSPLRLGFPGQATLTPAQVDALEAKLEEDPEDFSARRDLLLYYSSRDVAAKQRHVLWIIEHHPEFPGNGPEMTLDPNTEESAYKKGKQLWLQNVKNYPTNAAIIGRAAAYILPSDHEAGVELLKKAQALEPRNPAWSEQLGQIYQSETVGNPAATNSAAIALMEFEKARAQSAPSAPNSFRVVEMAKLAFAAGDIEKARTYADELLAPGLQGNGGVNDPYAFYYGNFVLGRIALREGKVEVAKSYLLASGKTAGNPLLNTFGPNMSLAKELLEKGETNAVLEFFQDCGKFWTRSGGPNKTVIWAADVKDGKMPDFGANLNY